MNVICNRLYGFINRFAIRIKRTLSIQPLHYEEPIRIYSPSDLITFMESPFASAMERSALNDPELRKLVDPPDNLLTSLQNRGFKHEQDFIQSLKLDDSLELINIEKSSAQQMIEETKMAMEEGKDSHNLAAYARETSAYWYSWTLGVRLRPGVGRLGRKCT